MLKEIAGPPPARPKEIARQKANRGLGTPQGPALPRGGRAGANWSHV